MSVLPASDSVDLSHATSKPRASSSAPAGVVQPCIVFPTTQNTPSGDVTPSPDLFSADILSSCQELDSTVLHSPSLGDTPHQASFVDDFLPLSLTANDILLH